MSTKWWGGHVSGDKNPVLIWTSLPESYREVGWKWTLKIHVGLRAFMIRVGASPPSPSTWEVWPELAEGRLPVFSDWLFNLCRNQWLDDCFTGHWGRWCVLYIYVYIPTVIRGCPSQRIICLFFFNVKWQQTFVMFGVCACERSFTSSQPDLLIRYSLVECK